VKKGQVRSIPPGRGRVRSKARCREAGRKMSWVHMCLGQALGQQQLTSLVWLCPLVADLAECKLVSFPIGIYKVLRNVTDQIRLITLANTELTSLTSKFMTTFSQLRGRSCSAQAQRERPALAL
jgi:hypothetical protein